MRATWLLTLVLASLVVCIAGQPPKPQPKLPTTATGVFLGKSGKPMAGARIILCEPPEQSPKIKLLPDVPIATADQSGRFTLRGFAPGKKTIIYLPAGVNAAVPNEFDVSSLEAEDKSLLPLLVRAELGTDKPYDVRQWNAQFALMKGHTFWSMGAKMKIWNATVRRGTQGPFLEMRRNRFWVQDIADKCQINLEAWSY